MNLFFRILLAVYAFCLTIISVIAIIVTLNPKMFDDVSDYIYNNLILGRSSSILLFVVEVIFLGISIIFLFSGFKSNKDKKSVKKHTNIGEIRISLNSIENIALAASRRLSGIRESKAYVTKHEDNVSIVIKTVVLPDVNIPALSEDMQSKVKKSVEDTSGVPVSNVSVIVENIYTGYSKSRVE
ncbi:MAG: alkaline shock response membrane anchor protein AmaP [Bacillota bacterium]|nr:alkaline shock response membrane anchor protein AmaP [Bacillota bacterium]